MHGGMQSAVINLKQHDSRQDGDRDSDCAACSDEVEEHGCIEEHLCCNQIRTCVDLGLEVGQLNSIVLVSAIRLRCKKETAQIKSNAPHLCRPEVPLGWWLRALAHLE